MVTVNEINFAEIYFGEFQSFVVLVKFSKTVPFKIYFLKVLCKKYIDIHFRHILYIVICFLNSYFSKIGIFDGDEAFEKMPLLE
jgi:hypothetical protein